MAEKVHRIHSLPDDSPWQGGLPPEGSSEHPPTIRVLDRVLAVQRPLVVAHLRSIRLRHPDASTADIVRMLERRYLATVTSSGAAVGATAVVPGIGTGITLALSGAETVAFLEATALFAQSLAELHGIRVENPDRARALVMTLMLGKEGVDLVSQLAGQAAGKGIGRSAYWGDVVTKSLPKAAVGPLVDRLKSAFIRQFAARGGASFLGKALPFGIGAAIGGTGNHILGRRVVTGARKAFGVPPARYPLDLEPPPDAERLESTLGRGVRRVGGAIGHGASGAASAVGQAARRVGTLGRQRREEPAAIESAADEDPAGDATATDAPDGSASAESGATVESSTAPGER